MKLTKQAFTRNIGRKILVTKKNSPHIFFVGGVVGVVGSTILACRATLQIEEKLDEIKNDVALIKRKAMEEVKINDDIAQKTLSYSCATYTVVKSVRVFGRLYGPSILLGGASIAALTGSHVQLTRRNAALSATLALVSKKYEDYRLRVQEEIGKERELDIYKDTALDTASEKDSKKEINKLVNSQGYSPYARFFDEGSLCWENDPEINLVFLRCQQNYMNQKLMAQGHLFLNEVYDSLGLERSSAGQIVGWVYNSGGDGYVDFGIGKDGNFVRNNLDRCVLLDFNVDGPVYDQI